MIIALVVDRSIVKNELLAGSSARFLLGEDAAFCLCIQDPVLVADIDVVKLIGFRVAADFERPLLRIALLLERTQEEVDVSPLEISVVFDTLEPVADTVENRRFPGPYHGVGNDSLLPSPRAFIPIDFGASKSRVGLVLEPTSWEHSMPCQHASAGERLSDLLAINN